jgi:threonine dehydratase
MDAPTKTRPTLDDIRAAAERIKGAVIRTPMMKSRTLSEIADAEVWLKFENLQFTAAYKERGALNALLLMDETQRKRGVIAASAGNHSQGLSYHGTRLGVPVTIVMPKTTPMVKVMQTEQVGGKVLLEGETYDEAYAIARSMEKQLGLTFVHPFDDPDVAAGQGTVALEMLEDAPELETLVVPIGGGGLISGIATAVKELRPHVRMIGVEPELASAMHDALEQGGPVSMVPGPTIADALKAPIAGELCHEICSRLVDEVVLVDEDAIAEATRFLYQRAKLAAEAGGAVGVAALLSGRLDVSGANGVAVVISGGNISGELSASVLDPR